jgi:hypothetical protein
VVDILFVVRWAYDGLQWFTESTYWCLVGNGWEWGNGMIITSDYGSFPHSLPSTSKKMVVPQHGWFVMELVYCLAMDDDRPPEFFSRLVKILHVSECLNV